MVADILAVVDHVVVGEHDPLGETGGAGGVLHVSNIMNLHVGGPAADLRCTMSSFDDPLDVRTETVGSCFANVECKIIDPDTGEECPIGR